MKVLSACGIVTVAVLVFLAAAVARDPKPPKAIEIIHLHPQLAMAPLQQLTFEVRITQPIDEDRELSALLCDLSDPPCTLEHYDRIDQISVEGSAAPKLWSPPPWKHIDAGEYVIAATIGPKGAIRASDVARVTVSGDP